MKKMKKYVAMMLAGLMAVSAVGCGSTADGESTSTGTSSSQSTLTMEEAKNVVYSAQSLDNIAELIGEYGTIADMVVVEDKIYTIVQEYSNTGQKTEYIQLDFDMNILYSFVIDEVVYENYDDESYLDDNMAVLEVTEVTEEVVDDETIDSYLYQYNILSNGTLTYIEEFSQYDEVTGMPIGEYHFVGISAEGTEIFRINLRDEFEEGEDAYINSIIESGRDTIFLCNASRIFELDMTGTIIDSVETNELTMWMETPIFYQDGYPVVGVWNAEYTDRIYQTIDVIAGETIEEVDVLDSLYNYTFSDGGASGYQLILTNSTGVYGYNVGDTEPTELMNLIASDISTSRLNNVCYLNETQFIATYYDMFTSEIKAAIFTKVAPEDVEDKEILTLACYYIDIEILKEIIAFNESNSTYKVLVEDYSKYNTINDYSVGLTKLNNDIVAGNVPDIIMESSDSLPMDNYATKGLFVDIYELMEADETIHKEDYVENVLKSYEVEEALYQIPTAYMITTVFGKASIFGDDTALTWDEFHEIMALYPESESFSVNIMTQSEMLTTALTYGYETYINRETGEVNFDSDDFKNVLEYAASFPEEIDWESLYNGDSDYWMSSQSQYIEDKTLLMASAIYDFSYLHENVYGSFLEEYTAVGFPTSEGMGSVLQGRNIFAISSKSNSVDGAWEFIKTFLSDDYQMPITEEEKIAGVNSDFTGIPVYIKALEETALQMGEKPHWYDSEGVKQEYELTTYIGGEEITFEPASQEVIEQYIDFAQSVQKRVVYSEISEITEIIQEEAAAFFSGQKSVDEVAKIIQSRMSIYISENS
ncbi:MAG: extracellular solute-binding protein [Lachnospiraceae bacterium]